MSAHVELVRHSLDAVGDGDPGFFKPYLPAREAWRLYSEFAEEPCSWISRRPDSPAIATMSR